MIAWITAIWLAIHSTDEQVEALRRYSPDTLTTETARQHLTAAWIASEVVPSTLDRGGSSTVHVDPNMLLYIAWHESRFTPSARTREPGHKTSCGVMTPIPMYRCVAGSLVEQYITGARHLQAWYDACEAHKNETESRHFDHGHFDHGLHDKCALTGFAGGWRLIRACKQHGHMWRQRGRGRIDLCATWSLYIDGALDMMERLQKDIR